MRVVAMLQVYNEQRFLAACIEHLNAQGVQVYVIDNESTDETLAIAERYVGRGVVGIETLKREGTFALRAQCARQEELAQTLDADWLIHHDADEMRVSPKRGQSLLNAITEIDAAGFNTVDFLEFTFMPTRESPDHDHPQFAQTMRWYYPFLPWAHHRVNAWKRQDGPVDLSSMGGHQVHFPGAKLAPQPLFMRHYLFLSVEHALEKFGQRTYDEKELERGWHRWRAAVRPEHIQLARESEFRRYDADHLLDASDPRKRHVVREFASPPVQRNFQAQRWQQLRGFPARAKRALARGRAAFGS